MKVKVWEGISRYFKIAADIEMMVMNKEITEVVLLTTSTHNKNEEIYHNATLIYK